jgi:hypothetical protein
VDVAQQWGEPAAKEGFNQPVGVRQPGFRLVIAGFSAAAVLSINF